MCEGTNPSDSDVDWMCECTNPSDSDVDWMCEGNNPSDSDVDWLCEGTNPSDSDVDWLSGTNQAHYSPLRLGALNASLENGTLIPRKRPLRAASDE